MTDGKKDILIMNTSLFHGGVEQGLVYMLNHLDYTKYNVDLLLIRKEGELTDSVNGNVNIIEVGLDKKSENILLLHANRELSVKNQLRRLKFFTSLRLIVDLKIKKKDYSIAVSWKDIPNVKKQYDVAVCYNATKMFCAEYVAKKVKAIKKIELSHDVYQDLGLNPRSIRLSLQQYDYHYTISKIGRKQFLEIFPEFEDKTGIYYNTVDEDQINLLAKAEPGFLQDGIFKILTVCRLVQNKGVDLAIDAAAILKTAGYRFRWYFIGDGILKQDFLCRVDRLRLGDCIEFTGYLKNVYPFIATCDLYMQPSLYEGWGLTVNEAFALKKCVVATKFRGAVEMIKNEKNGLLCDFNAKSISERVKMLLDDPNEIQRLAQAGIGCDNNKFEQFSKLMGD